MPIWSDFFRLFQYATEKDPLSARKDPRNFGTAGIAQPEALGTDFESGGGPGGQTSYRQTNDMIDTTTLSNRAMRYKEYERLRNVPEIELAVTVFSDEACVSGDTKISTPFGFVTIKELAEKRSEERFLVYCYDFKKKDYTLGWAFAPRLVKKDKTITIILDDGSKFTATKDHRVLQKDGTWIETGDLKFGDDLMAFYRLPATAKLKHKQFPRLFSTNRGWISERQFVDDWKTGKTDPAYEKANRVLRMVCGGLTVRQIAKVLEHDWSSIEGWIEKEGFTSKEIRRLMKKNDSRRVIGIEEGEFQEVYDISVEDHKCFATDSVILHNCQKDEDGNIFKIKAENDEVREEVEFLLLHRKMLNMNRNGWTWFKNLCISGDFFVEIVINPENPKEGIYRTVPLPPETMYRIETVKGKLIEFQQSKEGPDYQALIRGPVNGQNDTELNQTTAIRFAPSQIVHFRIGDDRKTFFPYGQSLIEPARGPAHSLRLMEDAMVVYRLCLVGDSRVRMKNGWKHIKNINIGDDVYCVLPGGKQSETSVIDWIDNGEQEILKVQSQHIEIRGTKTHPMLVNRNGIIQYVDLQDLQKGDQFVNVKNTESIPVEIPRIFGEKRFVLKESGKEKIRKNKKVNKRQLAKSCSSFCQSYQFIYRDGITLPENDYDLFKEAFELENNDVVVCNKGEINPERINLPAIVDEEFAKLFGFMLGDGFIVHGNQIGFATSPDEKTNLYYKGLLEKYFGKVSFEKDKRSSHSAVGKMIVSSKTACQIYLSMGYIPNKYKKRIPDWAFNADIKIRKALVEGLSDADGCERHTKAGLWFSTIELCNKNLVEDIKEIWHGLGLCSGHIKYRFRKNGHNITSNRKIKSTESWSVTISKRELSQYENIWSVRPDGIEKVYDITVADGKPHNFVVNGCCSHNTRAPERRVFYIDVGQLPPFKAEAFIDRLKDQFRKRKVTSNRGVGANQVEERWMPPAQDEDYWLPIRPNSNTRIDTLPGAENLGEIDDAVYFRNKLLISLNFPKNYFNNEDPGATRITLSAQDVKFARMIERLQSHFEDGILEIAEKHLQLRGFPEESYTDLRVKMTPPSDWRELSRSEVVTARYNNAGSLKGSQLMADYDIVTKILKYSPDEADEMLARLKLQKLEDLKLQVLSQNPQLLGVGIPSADSSQGQGELGSESGGPNTMPSPEDQGDQGGQEPPSQEGQETPPQEGQGEDQSSPQLEKQSQTINLPEPNEDEIKKYDLELQDYEDEQDYEDIDYSVGDE
jgi:intein/homing endonuclease